MNKLQPVLQIAVPNAPENQAMLNGEMPSSPGVRIIAFYLQRTEDRRCFYECTAAGCCGCGCPSFDATEKLEIPGDIIEHLEVHVLLQH